MKYNLLKQLKICTKNEWIQQYLIDSHGNIYINNKKNSSRNLYQLIETISARILSLSIKQKKLTIFVVETEPIKFLAAFLAGVITEVDIFLCDPAWQQQEWQQILNLVSPDLIFGDRHTQDLIVKETATVKNSASQKANLLEQSLIVIPTGGTSGKVRFAMHTWSTLTASVNAFKNYFNCQEINSFCTLPLYHVSGLMQFIRSFITQGKLLICPYQAVKIQPIVVINQPEYFISLVPTQLQFLIESIPNWLTQFKTVLLGGAPPMRSLLEHARTYNIPVALTYGMTETASGIVILKPEDFLTGNNSSGRVLPHAQITIEPKNNQPLDNNIGLIKINCASLCLGYYPQVFTQKLITDDLGYFDSKNYLYLVGRNSQKVITGGENVFPAEIEAVILATKLVKDVCVIGIPDSKWGEVVTAMYVPVKPNHDLQIIKRQVQSQLAKYKQPKNWIAVDSLFRNDRGKINYNQIKAIAIKVII